jgi:hypothetical protein
VPFHSSASVASVPAGVIDNPTAVQDLGEAHETPPSSLLTPTGFAVGWRVQRRAAALEAVDNHSATVAPATTAKTTIRAPIETTIRQFRLW